MNTSHKSLTQHGRTQAVTDEAILKISKEIVVKFIEMGKITPAGFELNFQNIYSTIEKTVRNK
ncbi:hypothetical protein LA52FAK_12020 [Desulforhopalus sp. 52FAK]